MDKSFKNKVFSVIIIDDHDTIISGLKHELSNKYKSINIKKADNVEEAIHLIKNNSFDIAIVDISFRNTDNFDGISLCKIIKQFKPKTKIISYSSYVERFFYLTQLKQIGVEAIVSKTDGNFFIIDAINKVLNGNTNYYSREVLLAMEQKQKKDLIAKKITPREKEILKLIHQNLTYQQIADTLFKSHSTIDTHTKNLFKKFDVHSKLELIQKTKDYIEI